MPRGFGRGFVGFGRGIGWFGWGRGFSNPYPFCRWFPWLPRWWWAYPAFINPSYYGVPWTVPSVSYQRIPYIRSYGYLPYMLYY